MLRCHRNQSAAPWPCMIGCPQTSLPESPGNKSRPPQEAQRRLSRSTLALPQRGHTRQSRLCREPDNCSTPLLSCSVRLGCFIGCEFAFGAGLVCLSVRRGLPTGVTAQIFAAHSAHRRRTKLAQWNAWVHARHVLCKVRLTGFREAWKGLLAVPHTQFLFL